MPRLFGPHPAIIAFLLAGGGFLALYFGWKIFSPPASLHLGDAQADLTQFLAWALMIAGVLMWLAGGILLGRERGMNGLLALLLHMLPVIGIILILIYSKRLTPHDEWARQNPGLDEKTAKRSYRPMKPLY